MASSKDTFEPKTFAANSFACGTWRGLGVTVAADSYLCGKITIQRTYDGTVKIQRTYDGTVAVNEC